MNRQESQAENLLRFEQMADISTAEVTAGIAVAAFLNRTEILSVGCVAYYQTTGMRHSGAVSGNACWEDAVKHINAQVYRFNNAVSSTHAHQVTRLILRHQLGGVRQDIVHHRLRLAYGQTADTITGKVQLCQLLHAHAAQLRIHTALHDTEHRLVLARMRFQTTLGPTGGTLGRTLSVIKISGIRDAFVKGHRDISAQCLLHLRRNLRREKLLAAVDMRTEHYALFGDFAHCTQAEYLKATTVGKHTAFIIHKLVQTASLAHQLVTRTQKQMIGIRQNNLAAHIIQLFRCQSFYRCLCADRHKHRSFKGTMRRMQAAKTCAAARTFFN